MFTKTKTRIKQFTDDHHEALIAFGAGIAIAGFFGLTAVSNTKDGMRLTKAAEYDDPTDDRKYLYVTHVNGEVGRYEWNKTDSTEEPF